MSKLVANDAVERDHSFTSMNHRIHERMRDLRIEKVPFYFKEGCKGDVVEHLKSLKEVIHSGNVVNWKILYHIITALSVTEETIPYCLSFLIEICNLLENYRCKDICLVKDVLRMIHLSSHVELNMLFLKRYVKYLKYKIHRFGGRDTSCIYDSFDGGDNFLWFTALNGNIGSLKLMLRFGMTIDTSNFYYTYDRNYARTLLGCGLQTESFSEYCRNFIIFNKLFSEDILEADDGTYSVPRRLWLIAGALEMFLLSQNTNQFSENYAVCYKLFFDSIDAPYVSSTELGAFLQCLISGHNDTILHFSKRFKRFFPDVPDYPQPRSLQHLCRIRIRKSLRLNGNLPHGVSSLKLPKILKKYILLNDDGVYPIVSTSAIWGRPVSDFKIPEEKDCVIEYIRNM